MKHILSPSSLSAEAIVDALLETSAAGSPGEWAQAERLWGAPSLDFSVTALSLRAGILGAKDGRVLYHHELRSRIPMPRSADPEISIWDGGSVPVWRDGVLTEPKYFSFFQDSPFAAYNPNYRRKWRAHEALHGAVGFFWRPDMTRFEFYVGARLNELLPVVHWYGLDEAFRPRCEYHQDVVLNRQFCWDCESLAVPYWHAVDGGRERRNAAIAHVSRSLVHFETELEIIRNEISQGRAIETSVGNVNGSSDAVGYLKGHWNRCTTWSFGTWVERYLIPAHDFEPTLTDLTYRVERVFRELLDGEVAAPHFDDRFRRRQVLDILARLLVMIELHDFEHEDLFAEVLDQGERLTGTLAPREEAFTAWRADLMERCETVGWGAVVNTGLEVDKVGLAQLGAGVRTIPDWDVEVSAESLQDFARSNVFWSQGSLALRLATWLQEQAHPDADRLAFQALLASEPMFDEELERFGTVPSVGDKGRVRQNHTLKLAAIDGAWIGEPFGPLNIAAFVVHNELRIVALDAALQAGIEHPNLDDDVCLGLIEEGILVFIPAPRG